MASLILLFVLALPILVNSADKETSECIEESKKAQGGPSCVLHFYQCCARKCPGDSEATCHLHASDRDKDKSEIDATATKCECKGPNRQDVTESCVRNARKLFPNSDVCSQHSECCRQTCLARRYGGFKASCVKDSPQEYDPGKAINMQHSQCICGAGSLIVSTFMIILAAIMAFVA